MEMMFNEIVKKAIDSLFPMPFRALKKETGLNYNQLIDVNSSPPQKELIEKKEPC